MHFVCFQRHEMDACRRKFQLWIQNLKNSFFWSNKNNVVCYPRQYLCLWLCAKWTGYPSPLWTTSGRQSTLSSQHNLRLNSDDWISYDQITVGLHLPLKMTSIKMHLQGFLENKRGTGAWTWKFKFIKLYWHNRCSVQISPYTVWMFCN